MTSYGWIQKDSSHLLQAHEKSRQKASLLILHISV